MIQIEPGLWLAPDGRHDTRSGEDVVSPLTPEEMDQVLRKQLEDGIQAFLDAKNRAEADVAVAETARQAVLILRDALVWLGRLAGRAL